MPLELIVIFWIWLTISLGAVVLGLMAELKLDKKYAKLDNERGEYDYKKRQAEIAAMTDEQRAEAERKLDEKYEKLRN
jgi:hypothetical protein